MEEERSDDVGEDGGEGHDDVVEEGMEPGISVHSMMLTCEDSRCLLTREDNRDDDEDNDDEDDEDEEDEEDDEASEEV